MTILRVMPPGAYAVIFTSRRAPVEDGYYTTAARMLELAQSMPGFLGVESARDNDGFGITVSYWESEAAIAAWREHAEHRLAQQQGRAKWYEQFDLQICQIVASRTYHRGE